MLNYLSVQNLAIIDKLELELDSGLTVITGETGAGKSMLLHAVILLLGGRLTEAMIRTGADTLALESAWSPGPLGRQLEILLGEEVGEELLIRRTARFTEKGKRDRLHIAGNLQTQGTASKLAGLLVNIASQHEYVSLLRKAEHIRILDHFAGHSELLEKMAGAWRHHEELSGQLRDMQQLFEQRETRVEELRGLADELAGLELKEGEEDEILSDIARLSHAADIVQAVEAAIHVLYEEDRAVVSSLSLVEKQLAGISQYEGRVEPVLERLSGAAAEMEDVTSELRDILSRVDLDPAWLDHLQERLSKVQKLKRKHQADHSDQLLALLHQFNSELARLDTMELDIRQKKAECLSARQEMSNCAQKLSKSRLKAARQLASQLGSTLSSLEMKKARLEASLEFDEDAIALTGGDHVEFVFSANPGESLKPMQKIASGGELSRVLLAFKAVLADAYPVPTYIFDEIDSGIGGKTALAAGKLLSQLAKNHQVICITHTAQIAAFADQHLVADKQDSGGTTTASIKTLRTEEERVAELARMLSGLDDSKTALSHARELLLEARGPRGALL